MLNAPTTKKIACAIAMLATIGSATVLYAQLEIGTWTRTDAAGAGIELTIEACCNGGRRLTYRFPGNTLPLMIVESPLDGSDAPVIMGGKASGETMGIKRIDAHHADTLLKMNGKPFGTSKATLSADGKTLTVVNDATTAVSGMAKGVTTETWVKK